MAIVPDCGSGVCRIVTDQSPQLNSSEGSGRRKALGGLNDRVLCPVNLALKLKGYAPGCQPEGSGVGTRQSRFAPIVHR
jgi:hypothetical protein